MVCISDANIYIYIYIYVYIHIYRLIVQNNGGDATDSLVVAQQNYNKMKWRQCSLLVGNCARVRIQRKVKNCILLLKIQQVNCALRQLCMFFKLSSPNYVTNIQQILDDLGQIMG